jgi:hypothetical protein
MGNNQNRDFLPSLQERPPLSAYTKDTACDILARARFPWQPSCLWPSSHEVIVSGSYLSHPVPMVICVLLGGLGNQLFQYAVGRALAIRLNTSLKLDASYFTSGRRRTYELERFRIQASRVNPFERWAAPRWERPRVARAVQVLRKLGLPIGFTSLRDREQGFDERIVTVTGNVSLRGFWQSERYFASVADIIRDELVLRDEPDQVNQAMLDAIGSTESVALHVRRGDYLITPKHGTCPLDYYHQAIEKMLLRVRDPHLFIFSDDPDWTRENIKTGFPTTYVTHNTGRQDFEDLRLMSHCRHFIIANSSFSWWGAWLSRNRTKNIIAPKRWFADPNQLSADFIPPAWMVL